MIINDNGTNNIIQINESAVSRNAVITINGSNNHFFCDENTQLNAKIYIHGDHNNITIGKKCRVNGGLHIRHGGSIEIDNYSTFVHADIFAIEGEKVHIGKDCLFSSGIVIRTSDEHSIIDNSTKKRINHAKPVYISDRVWIGEGVRINKGVTIAKETIIGTGSIVTHDLLDENSIYVGSPARLIKSNVSWNRRLIDKNGEIFF